MQILKLAVCLYIYNLNIEPCSLAKSLLFVEYKSDLSYDVMSWSEITPCNKIDKPLKVYRFTGNVMTSITMLRTQ